MIGRPIGNTQGRQDNFWAHEQKETWPLSSNSPNNDTQRKKIKEEKH
jgi:hypothetical protein